jgi:hypothetical protein
MSNRFYFNKKRVGFGVAVFAVLNVVSICFIIYPEIFIRNFLMKKEAIQIVGFLSFIYSLLMFYSFLVLLFRKKEAFIISEDYLVDNSKFESVGKVYFSEIMKVKRLNKNSLEITLKAPIFNSKKLNFIKKVICMLNNWNYKNSIIISSALLDCDIKSLEKDVLEAWESYKVASTS